MICGSAYITLHTLASEPYDCVLVLLVRAYIGHVSLPVVTLLSVCIYHSLYMIGATGSVRGKKEFEPNSLAPESEPLLGPHLEDYWSIEDYWARSGGLLG